MKAERDLSPAEHEAALALWHYHRLDQPLAKADAIMALGFTCLFFTLHLASMRNEIWSRRISAMRRLAARQVGDA